MNSLALVLAAFALSGRIVAPHDNYRPPPRNSVYMDRDGDGVPNRYDRAPTILTAIEPVQSGRTPDKQTSLSTDCAA